MKAGRERMGPVVAGLNLGPIDADVGAVRERPDNRGITGRVKLEPWTRPPVGPGYEPTIHTLSIVSRGKPGIPARP